jgi:hypothetical protein
LFVFREGFDKLNDGLEGGCLAHRVGNCWTILRGLGIVGDETTGLLVGARSRVSQKKPDFWAVTTHPLKGLPFSIDPPLTTLSNEDIQINTIDRLRIEHQNAILFYKSGLKLGVR